MVQRIHFTSQLDSQYTYCGYDRSKAFGVVQKKKDRTKILPATSSWDLVDCRMCIEKRERVAKEKERIAKKAAAKK